MNRDEEVKQEIAEAARRVFSKWGLNKTTMEDIAQEARKGKSTLYNYFGSKEEIFELLAVTELMRIIDRAKESLDAAATAREKLRTYIATELVEIKKTVGLYPFITGDLKADREFIRHLRTQLDKHEEQVLLKIIQEGVRKGEFKFLTAANAHKAASVIVELMRGMEIYLVFDEDDPEKLDIAVALVTQGL
jgi:AcrR family transcriptional regulator